MRVKRERRIPVPQWGNVRFYPDLSTPETRASYEAVVREVSQPGWQARYRKPAPEAKIPKKAKNNKLDGQP